MSSQPSLWVKDATSIFRYSLGVLLMLHDTWETPLLFLMFTSVTLIWQRVLPISTSVIPSVSKCNWPFAKAPITCHSFANIKMAPSLSQFTLFSLLGLLSLFENAYTAPVLPSGWASNGCYVDNVSGRILSYQFPDNKALTVENCISSCSGKGYTVAGMEYGVQCFCDSAIINGGKPAASPTECNVACGGNSAEQCGGGSRMNIYSTGTLTTRGPPGPQKTNLPGSWAYKGCIK